MFKVKTKFAYKISIRFLGSIVLTLISILCLSGMPLFLSNNNWLFDLLFVNNNHFLFRGSRRAWTPVMNLFLEFLFVSLKFLKSCFKHCRFFFLDAQSRFERSLHLSDVLLQGLNSVSQNNVLMPQEVAHLANLPYRCRLVVVMLMFVRLLWILLL